MAASGLTKLDEARSLLAEGRFKKAVAKLWWAEAEARGDPARLRDVLDVARAVETSAGARPTADLDVLTRTLEERIERGASASDQRAAASPSQGWSPAMIAVGLIGAVLFLVFIAAEAGENGVVDGVYAGLAVMTLVVTLIIELVLVGWPDGSGKDGKSSR